MSQAQPKKTEYDGIVDTELAKWPGVAWSRQPRGKHQALVLEFGGVSRFVIYPTTPGDSGRGALNHLQNVRGVLKELGAVREAVPKAKRPHRRQNRTTAKVVDLGERAARDPGRDPFTALAGFRRQLVNATPFVLPIRNSHRPWWKLWRRA